MKIVYCIDAICHLGGIERITIAKANALADMEGNQVWIVAAEHRKPFFPLLLSEKVNFVNLGVNYTAEDWKGKWYVLKGFLGKRALHKKRLKQSLDEIQPDIVISTGYSEKYFLSFLKVKSKPVFIREIHYTSDYRRRTAYGWYWRLMAWASDFLDYRILIKKYDCITVLTQEDKNRYWNNDKKVVVMPNPLTVKHNQRSTLTNKVVVTAGRLTYPKNYPSLIRAWGHVERIHPDWRLMIWGDGGDKNMLEEQIDSLGLNDKVHLMGYTDDIMSKFADASIFVLSSRYEGFALVLLEAMSCGLPAVSYACPCGPSDIVTDGKDGFLVALGNEGVLAKCICHLIEDEELRRRMGKAALERSKAFAMDKIIARQMNLFTTLIHNKRRSRERK